MSELLNELRFQVQKFETALGEALGRGRGEEGHRVLSHAIAHGRTQVESRDFLYCLADTPGTFVRREMVEFMGSSAEQFITSLEEAYSRPELSELPPSELTVKSAAESAIQMLDRLDQIGPDPESGRFSESRLVLALLETTDDVLQELLELWLTKTGLSKLREKLQRGLIETNVRPLFTEQGDLDWNCLAPSARRVCQRMVRDATGLGAHKLTSRHMLYSILDDENGLLASTLAHQGINARTDLHARLVRELKQVGQRISDPIHLSRDTLFESVRVVLERSLERACERNEDRLADFDLQQAFAELQMPEITRLVSQDPPFDPSRLLSDLRLALPHEEPPDEQQNQCSVRAIEQNIRNTIFGQDLAVERILPWVKRLRFGLPREHRPAGVFLFLGPTGTGKTQMAKELCRYVFGHEELLFLEMGQFKTRETMSGLIGAPPGYVGYGEGKLTNGLRDNAETVVLFDEIEKSDTEVFDVILRFADEGLISDPAGPVRDGRKCIIVMTTNAGQAWLRQALRTQPELVDRPSELRSQLFDQAIEELLQSGFRPEFLGRIDDRITFLPFTRETCQRILEQVLDNERERFLRFKQIELRYDESVQTSLVDQFLERSLDEGARAAPRLVNQYVITPTIDRIVDDDENHDTSLGTAGIRAVEITWTDTHPELKVISR